MVVSEETPSGLYRIHIMELKVHPKPLILNHSIRRQRLKKERRDRSRQQRQSAPDTERLSVPTSRGVTPKALMMGGNVQVPVNAATSRNIGHKRR